MNRNTSYLVQWEIEIDASSPADAALKAWNIAHDQHSVANFFTVLDENGDVYPILIQELIENDASFQLTNKHFI